MASTIYETLKAEIRSGQLSSDTPLREVELAERFGVSRTPIREALHRLSSEKLIRTLPNAGAFVGMFTWEDAREIFAIRQVLEAFAAGLTAQFIPPGSIQHMQDLLEKMSHAVQARAIETYAVLDEEFHTILNENCNNKNLMQIIDNLNDQSKLADLRRNQYQVPGRMEESLAQHRKIVAAIQARDPKQVSNLLMIHGQNIFGDVTKIDLPNELF
ncbi:MAG: GntR family transcriptional regulator [Anaerolineaceae bacterium]|nr:GntR family transcriptional regulator [Anaerolineaceae bacterium]